MAFQLRPVFEVVAGLHFTEVVDWQLFNQKHFAPDDL
jgi:hypothetical protein